jgi:hypothetical protein
VRPAVEVRQRCGAPETVGTVAGAEALVQAGASASTRSKWPSTSARTAWKALRSQNAIVTTCPSLVGAATSMRSGRG